MGSSPSPVSRVKKVSGFHLPNSPWPRFTKLFLARESLVSDIPAGDGKPLTFFTMKALYIPAATHREVRLREGGGRAVLAEEGRGLRRQQKAWASLILCLLRAVSSYKSCRQKKVICVNVCFFHSSVLVDPLR